MILKREVGQTPSLPFLLWTKYWKWLLFIIFPRQGPSYLLVNLRLYKNRDSRVGPKEEFIVTRLDFADTEKAFAPRTDQALKQSYWLFKALSFPSVVAMGPTFTDCALKLKLPVKGILKATIFKQFCGGESVDDCQKTIDWLYENQVGTILDYATEGFDSDENFDRTLNQILECIQKAQKEQAIPFCVFKPTGVIPFSLMEKASIDHKLTKQEQAALDRGVARFEKICHQGADRGVPVFVDAEETWIQPFVDKLVGQMMRTYNRSRAIIYNTVQMYRHDRLKFLDRLIKEATAENFQIGVKVVRGAYLEKENDRAARLGIESPLYQSKEETDAAYDEAIDLLMKNVDRCYICAGTHNEESTKKFTKLILESGRDLKDPRFYFAQLLGMSDHLTFNLASSRFATAKYVPYGPLEDVLPYLARRARENSSVKGQTGRELRLIREELDRRQRSHE